MNGNVIGIIVLLLLLPGNIGDINCGLAETVLIRYKGCEYHPSQSLLTMYIFASGCPRHV